MNKIWMISRGHSKLLADTIITVMELLYDETSRGLCRTYNFFRKKETQNFMSPKEQLKVRSSCPILLFIRFIVT